LAKSFNFVRACFRLPYFRSNPALLSPWSATSLGLLETRRFAMPSTTALETELRHAVIDRLIAASLRDSAPAREATLQRWRTLDAKGDAAPKQTAS
jgi:hypothetical protein